MTIQHEIRMAQFHKREGTDNLIGRPGRFRLMQCARKATVTIGKLRLCSAHARMTREGFVDERGNVENPNTVADCKRYGITPPYSWARDADPT